MANYYISFSQGLDTNNGTSESSPWKNLSRVATSSIVAGDIVSFKRGDIWAEQSLNVVGEATLQNPITYTSYGVGDLPKFSGLRRITSWVNQGNGIYSYQSNDLPSYLRLVKVNQVLQGKGKFPNKGYLPITSNATTTSVTSSLLTNTVNYSGAEIVSVILAWVIDRKIISSHSGGTLNFPAMQYTNRVGYGFFVQNHINCLNDLGDWMYNESTKTLSMYFGAVNPDTVDVDVSVVANGVTMSRVGGNINNYKVIENIHIEGYNNFGITKFDSSNNTFQHLLIENIGQKGITATLEWYLTTGNKYLNNTVRNCHEQGIQADKGCIDATIENNLVENIGMDIGLSGVGELQSDAINAGNDLVRGANITIKNNKVKNVGYIGINAHGTNVLVENNVVDGFCRRRHDGAGIYTYDTVEFGVGTWRKNICINGGFDDMAYFPEGVEGTPLVFGFYCDNQTGNYLLEDNVAAFNQFGGFNLNDPRNITMSKNISYNNGFIQFTFNGSESRNNMTSTLNIQNNIWYSNLPTQPYLDYKTNSSQSHLMMIDDFRGQFAGYGLMNNNYFLNGNNINQAVIIHENFTAYQMKSKAAWATQSGHEVASSIGSGIDLTYSTLVYNDSFVPKNYQITGNAFNKDNQIEDSQFSLAPFEFKLLLGDVTVYRSGALIPSPSGMIRRFMKAKLA